MLNSSWFRPYFDVDLRQNCPASIRHPECSFVHHLRASVAHAEAGWRIAFRVGHVSRRRLWATFVRRDRASDVSEQDGRQIWLHSCSTPVAVASAHVFPQVRMPELRTLNEWTRRKSLGLATSVSAEHGIGCERNSSQFDEDRYQIDFISAKSARKPATIPVGQIGQIPPCH